MFASILMLTVSGLTVWPLAAVSLAQQEPSRQLMQTNAQPVANLRRIALVIGNGAYTNAPPLKNPPNDARDMAATLKLLGFSVSSAIDADQRTMKRLIREFGQQLKTGGQGLFYYAGHGVQMRGRNYLIPANADITSETDVEDQSVDLNLVLGLMDEAQNGLNIVILDACRNNPFTRSFRSAGAGLAQVDAPTGTLIAYATSPGRVASDGQGRNGLYTSELLSQMRVTGIGVEEMLKRVRAGVRQQTSGQQVPWESSSLVGNFYFAVPTAPETSATGSSSSESRLALDAGAFELSYWDTIKNSTNAEDFKAYLEKYPNGQFASLAKNRVNSMDSTAKPIESRTPMNNSATEIAFWDSIKNSASADDYRAYLEKYPNGEFAVLAKRRLAPLETAEKASTSEPSSVDPTAKTFIGYLGVMSAGFSARPGKLMISKARIQFIWDKGTEGISDSRTDGLSGSKAVTYSLHPDPKPYELQCSNFTQAKTEGFFIREIGQISLVDAIGWGGAIGRFRASSPAEAIAALAAVREACSDRSPSEKSRQIRR